MTTLDERREATSRIRETGRVMVHSNAGAGGIMVLVQTDDGHDYLCNEPNGENGIIVPFHRVRNGECPFVDGAPLYVRHIARGVKCPIYRMPVDWTRTLPLVRDFARQPLHDANARV